MESWEFVESVWAAQPHKTGWVFISFKQGDAWTDKPLRVTAGTIERIKLPKNADVYFCPTIFRKPHRKIEFALPTVWLHADLDEVEPEGVALSPTSAWSTSKGRYQCLWRVTEALDIKKHRAFNQRLTYLTGADKGGWSITKVLRVPGTLNHKRGKPERVRLLWDDLQHYLPRVILSLVRDVEVVKQVGVKDLDLPDVTADALYHKYKSSMPTRAKQLLMAKRAIVGQRSERLWELECLLLDVGIKKEEVLILVRNSVWNKYTGQRRELPQLWAEVNKASVHVSNSTKSKQSNTSQSDNGLQLVSFNKFLAKPLPSELWTVEGVWSHEAHGLIAGEPKTYKSIVATDLAVSVASGTKFLGHFEVPEKGPVIIIQEENTEGMMKDRLEKIAHAKSLNGRVHRNGAIELPEELPIRLMNNQRFNLLDQEHTDWLEEQIDKTRPKLVVLDPLYLMIPGVNESSQADITPVLRDLLMLKQRYNVGILLVHHYNKPREEESRHPGNRISGTSVFYRWFESALYLEKGTEPGQVKATPEHRGHAPGSTIFLEFDMGEMGEPDYHVDVEIRKAEGSSLRRALRDIVEDNSGITLTQLAHELQITRDRARRLSERVGCRFKEGKADGSKGRPSVRVYPKRGAS